MQRVMYHLQYLQYLHPFRNVSRNRGYVPSFTSPMPVTVLLNVKNNLITQKQVTKGQNVCNKGHQSNTSKVCESNRARPISRPISSDTTPLEGDSEIKPRMHVLFCSTAVAL